MFGIVEVRAFVDDLRVVLQAEEAMRESGRNPEHAHLLVRELDTGPFPLARRLATQIHGHVECRSGNNADELPLSLPRPKLEPAQYALAGPAVIVLYEGHIQ